MNHLPISVQRYLNKYSLGCWKLEHQLPHKIDNAIVIPVIAEYENLKLLFASLLKNEGKYFEKSAVIIVVNNFEDSSSEVRCNNQLSLQFLRMIIEKKHSDDPITSELIKSKINICLIDASSKGLEMPMKTGGVGLARKIGMDEALKIFDYDSPSKNILICLDADCTVEPNYLTAIIDEFNSRNLSAAHVNFQHNTSRDLPTTHAIICYEIFLRYYVLGLKYAESPFAFHTIGSTMICDHESYIKIEGMNKQKAAEDFYFLEKLAKNYKVEKINSTVVYPSARSSWRVPFGTGQRVQRFLSHEQNEYLLYDPKTFDILKSWIEHFHSSEIKNSKQYLSEAKHIHPELIKFLVQQNFASDWEKILSNSTKSEQLGKQKQKWFDGFKTLKLIHHLRDTAFPQSDMFVALNGLFERIGIEKEFFWFDKCIPDIDIQTKYLELLREVT